MGDEEGFSGGVTCELRSEGSVGAGCERTVLAEEAANAKTLGQSMVGVF